MFYVPKKNRTPLTVIVKDGQYTMLGDANSPWHGMLSKQLQAMGGINESVQDGTYHFNMKAHRFFKVKLTLLPAE